MDRKNCVVCYTEKSIDIFYNKYRKCEVCIIKRSLKGYYENKKKYQINGKYIMKKIEINYYKNKMIDIYKLKT